MNRRGLMTITTRESTPKTYTYDTARERVLTNRDRRSNAFDKSPYNIIIINVVLELYGFFFPFRFLTAVRKDYLKNRMRVSDTSEFWGEKKKHLYII